MLRVYHQKGRQLVPSDLEIASESPPPASNGALWLDLINPARQEAQYVERVLGVSVPTREEAQDIEISARLLAYHTTTTKTDKGPSKDAAVWVKDMTQDVTALSDHATYLSNKTSFLLDATLGLINLEQNQIIKIFSIAAVVLLPPTLVATIYGMNFKGMPELEWSFGYPWALSLIVITALVPFLWFRRKGWL